MVLNSSDCILSFSSYRRTRPGPFIPLLYLMNSQMKMVGFWVSLYRNTLITLVIRMNKDGRSLWLRFSDCIVHASTWLSANSEVFTPNEQIRRYHWRYFVHFRKIFKSGELNFVAFCYFCVVKWDATPSFKLFSNAPNARSSYCWYHKVFKWSHSNQNYLEWRGCSSLLATASYFYVICRYFTTKINHNVTKNWGLLDDISWERGVKGYSEMKHLV